LILNNVLYLVDNIMSLSRHFYNQDEIEAALLYSSSRSIPNESLFWTQELILSNCSSEAISILFQSYLWNTGPLRLQMLMDVYKSLAKDEISEDFILLATYQLSTIRHTNRDTSLWNILVLTLQNPNKIPDTITRKTPNVLPSDDPKEIYFVRAIYQQKARSAWWISQYIKTDRVWELLCWVAENIHTKYASQYKDCLEALMNYEKLLGYKSAEYDVIIRCAAVLMMCINEKQQEQSFKPLISEIDSENLKTLDEWVKLVGRKERRVYQIPNACLYGTTVRGRSKWTQSNLTQLYNIEENLVGSPCWVEILSSYAELTENNKINWFSDDKMEEFYNKYFEDDIPDEWSLTDKLQSHGYGLLSPNEKPNIAKYSRNYLTKIPHLAWNTNKIVNSYLETLDINDCLVENIFHYYTPPIPLTNEDLKRLEPVHKIKVI
jgi:hypothetical protein